MPASLVVADDPPTLDPSVQLRRRRRVILGAVLALISVFVWDLVAGRIVHDQRQRHLAYDVSQPKSVIGDGEALMILQIPQLGLNTVVVEGASSSDLRSGPGHVRATATPGEKNNVVVLARRSRYAGPFDEIATLKPGAQIAVKSRAGVTRGYAVESVTRVDADSRTPLAATKDERLTLVTSASGLFPDRLVVVTAKVVAGPPTVAMKRTFAPAKSSLDDRPISGPLGALLLLVVLSLMVVAVMVGGAELRRRYSLITAAGVLLPVVGLLALTLVFAVDAVLPATF